MRGLATVAALVLAALVPPAAAAREPIISYVDAAGTFRLYDEEIEQELPPPPVPAGFLGFRHGMSLDSRYIVFNDEQKKLHLLDRFAGAEVALPGIDVDPNPAGLTVSNTGLIAFDSAGNGPARVYDSVAKAFVNTGLAADNGHRQTRLSGDGRFLATTCLEDDCVVNDGNSDSDVYVQDLVTRQDTGFPDDLNGPDRDEEHPCIDADGSLVAVDIRNDDMKTDVYRYDRSTGQQVLPVLQDPDVNEAFCALDPDGGHVALFNDDIGFRIWKQVEARYVVLPAGREFDNRSQLSAPPDPGPQAPTMQPPTPPAVTDVNAPGVTGFEASNPLFAVTRVPTPTLAARRRIPNGTRFRFRLTERADVTIAIEQRARGRRVGRRCRRPSRRLRRRRACTRYIRRGALVRRALPAGRASVRFSGRIGRRRPLRPARYRGSIVARDVAGNASRPRRANFRVVRRSRR